MRFVGIDPSISGTGLVILDEKGDIVIDVSIKTKVEGDPARFIDIAEQVFSYLNPKTDIVLIEGYAFGAKGQGVSIMYGIGWTIRLMLHQSLYSWGEIPPTQVKKFGTNKGNIKKDLMPPFIEERWGYVPPKKTPRSKKHDDDVLDAYILARIGYHMYNHEGLLEHEKEVLSNLPKIKL